MGEGRRPSESSAMIPHPLQQEYTPSEFQKDSRKGKAREREGR